MQMGIQKIAFWNPTCSKVSYSANTGGGKGGDDKVPFGSDLEDDPDDSEIAEFSCELGMLEGKVCSIPYKLYDLPDLRDIFSLDTWNSCLTEEDRFLLSAYLPDMDQRTFILTMKELFDGSDIYFGNPLDTFFRRLKAGFYPPKVACLREGLMFLQKIKYYHSLRSYHNKMVRVFKDMRWLWDGCEKYYGVEERISIWKIRRTQRAISFLDLNQYPPKDDLMTPDEVKSDTGMIFVDSPKSANDVLSCISSSRTKFISPTVNAKHFQKMKAPVIGQFQKHCPKRGASDAFKQYQHVPKGLLKILPKPSVQLQQTEMGPEVALPNFMTMAQSLRDFSFSSLPTHVQNSDGLCGRPFLTLKLDGSRVDSSLAPPLSLLNQGQRMTGINGNMESFTRRTEGQMVPHLDVISVSRKRKMFGNTTADEGSGPAKVFMPSSYLMGAGSYTFGGHNLLPNLGIGTQDISLRSLESKALGLQCQEGNQCVTKMKDQLITMHPRISLVLQGTSDAGASKQKTWIMSSLDKMKDESLVGDRRSGTKLTESSVSARLKDETVLPLTYKRRKALTKLKSSDFGKTLTLGANLNPAIRQESNQDLVMVQKQYIYKSQGGQT